MSEPSLNNSSRRRPRLQFSLLALFLVVTAACFLVAWLAQPEQREAVALFRVNATPPTLVGNRPLAFDSHTFKLLQNSHVEMIRSDFVMQAAIRPPGIASLAMLKSREDPAQWLADNINIEFVAGSEIMSISLRGPASMSNDIRAIVDAV